MKKILLTSLALLAVITLSACKPKEFTVTFDTQGGTAVEAVVVVDGEVVAKPEANPTKDAEGEDSAWSFTDWYTDAAGTTAFDFTTPIEADTTLYAGWTQQIVVRFNTKTDATVESALLSVDGGDVAKPTDPTREDFTFGGWFYGKPGATWLEPEAITFPLAVTEAVELFAYWIPEDSAAVTWDEETETYRNSFTELTADPILNPLTYHWSHESALMDYMSTPLYGTDVDWEKAIEDGLATEPGDFSTIDESNIGALLRMNVMYGAAQFPIAVGGDFDGEDGTDQNGKFSESLSREITSTTYRYKLNPDVLWEDGTPVTAHDYYYSYFQYIDGTQNNFRASSYYPTHDRNTGMKIVNSRGYFLQGTEIGLGESADNPLEGDYAYGSIKRSIGPNNTTYAGGYAGLWYTSEPRTVYLTEAQVAEYGFVDGEDYAFPMALQTALLDNGWTEEEIIAHDIQGHFQLNANYAGAKGTDWPAVSKDEVGFKVIDDYTFEMTYEVTMTHTSAMFDANFTLVHPETYEDSLDENGTNSTYGTSLTPPLSYGGYVLKSWDTNAKMVFNKNYTNLMQLYYNYKAISFEFYSNIPLKMTAFENGKLSSTTLNQTYYSEYAENPNLKSSYRGYPGYLMFNTRAYDGQDLSVVSAIQDKDFRQAFFFGFNRVEYATTINAPNVPSLLAYPVNATQYDNDDSWYTNTPEYKQLLDDLGIDETTYGYDPVKAVELFNAAYAAWDAIEGNEGPIELNYLTSEGAETARIDDYIISHFETLFGTDKIVFNKDIGSTQVASDKQDAFEFDIVLTGVGTGASTNLSVMLPIVGLFAFEVWGGFGFNTMADLNIPESELIIEEADKLDLRATWEFLKTVTDKFDEDTDSGTLWPLWEILNENDGYFVGDLTILHDFGLECIFIWAGLAPQYDGDVEDRNTVTRAFDRIILEYAPLIPTTSAASAVVYADNVTNVWPAYHNIMRWGGLRYWHLNSDSDFQ